MLIRKKIHTILNYYFCTKLETRFHSEEVKKRQDAEVHLPSVLLLWEEVIRFRTVADKNLRNLWIRTITGIWRLIPFLSVKIIR